MAEPVTTTAALTASSKATYTAAATAAAVAATAYSTYQQGQAQKSWNEYNAAIARMKAETEQQAAQASAERIRMQNEQLRARQRFAYGISGVTPAGTPENLLADTAALQQLDVDTLLWNAGAKSAYSIAESNLMEAQAKTAGRSGTIMAGTSLLSGMTQAAQQYQTNARWNKLLDK